MEADGQTVSTLLPDAHVEEVSPPAHSRAQSVCVYIYVYLYVCVCVCESVCNVCSVAYCEHCSSLTATSQ